MEDIFFRKGNGKEEILGGRSAVVGRARTVVNPAPVRA